MSSKFGKSTIFTLFLLLPIVSHGQDCKIVNKIEIDQTRLEMFLKTSLNKKEKEQIRGEQNLIISYKYDLTKNKLSFVQWDYFEDTFSKDSIKKATRKKVEIFLKENMKIYISKDEKTLIDNLDCAHIINGVAFIEGNL